MVYCAVAMSRCRLLRKTHAFTLTVISFPHKFAMCDLLHSRFRGSGYERNDKSTHGALYHAFLMSSEDSGFVVTVCIPRAFTIYGDFSTSRFHKHFFCARYPVSFLPQSLFYRRSLAEIVLWVRRRANIVHMLLCLHEDS